MAGRKRYRVLRDPVHGDVQLTGEELRVLDTPEMQRLRGVRQLGAAHLVYPGALHTRFDHMIGSLHMAGRMIEAVELSPQNAYIRRLQHQMAERANLVSRSRGREPFRRVRLYPDAARSTWR